MNPINMLSKIMYALKYGTVFQFKERYARARAKPSEIIILAIDPRNKLLKVASAIEPSEREALYKKKKNSQWIFWVKFNCLQQAIDDIFSNKRIFVFRGLVKKNISQLSVIHVYSIIYPGKLIENLWVLTDRGISGDDNAEHLFNEICHLSNILDKYFIYYIGEGDKLKSSNFINYKNTELKSYLKTCGVFISSHVDFNFLKYLNRNGKFVFLQHGVNHNNISSWLNNKKIDLMTCSSVREFESIVSCESPYKLTAKEVKLIGMPRLDYLYKNNNMNKDKIIISPTWRTFPIDSHEMRLYLKNWGEVLKTESFAEISKLYDIIFIAHPKLYNLLCKEIILPDYIKMKPEYVTYSELLISTRLLITDYSSLAFDLAYLKRGTLYYQFDKEDFFRSGVIKKNTLPDDFSYYDHGFGPVCGNLNDLLSNLSGMLTDTLDEKYITRMEQCFKYFDDSNSKRTIQEIINLS